MKSATCMEVIVGFFYAGCKSERKIPVRATAMQCNDHPPEPADGRLQANNRKKSTPGSRSALPMLGNTDRPLPGASQSTMGAKA